MTDSFPNGADILMGQLTHISVILTHYHYYPIFVFIPPEFLIFILTIFLNSSFWHLSGMMNCGKYKLTYKDHYNFIADFILFFQYLKFKWRHQIWLESTKPNTTVYSLKRNAKSFHCTWLESH